MGRVLSYRILWAFGIPKEGSTSVRGYRQAVDKLVLGRALKQSLLSALCLRTGLCMQFAITQEPAGKMQNRAVSYMKEFPPRPTFPLFQHFFLCKYFHS